MIYKLLILINYFMFISYIDFKILQYQITSDQFESDDSLSVSLLLLAQIRATNFFPEKCGYVSH